MLLAHKIELRPTEGQKAYLRKACGCRRFTYNALLREFSNEGRKWSKASAYQFYMKEIRTNNQWLNEVSSRISRNAIDDLDNAFKHFFRRIKLGEKPGYPRYKRKFYDDSFGHDNLLVAVSGNVNSNEIISYLEEVQPKKTTIYSNAQFKCFCKPSSTWCYQSK